MKISVLKSRSTVGFQRAALIESDEYFGAQIAGYAEDVGLSQVEMCPTIDDFWQADSEKFDLVIIDWNSKGDRTAMSLFNRLRHDANYSMLPIVIISGFLDRNDFRLMNEFPLTRLLEKPFTAGVFIEAVQSLQDEKNWVLSHEAPIRRLLSGPQSVEVPRVRKLLKTVKTAPYPLPLLLMIGRFLSREKRWDEAYELFRSVVDENPKHVLALNELGKVLHAKGRHKEAIQVLSEADILSPANIKRICHIGELQLNDWRVQDAKKNFERALSVDARWERAQHGHRLSTNVFEYMQQYNMQEAIPKSFASLLNSMGIIKVRNGELQEGVQHYESALNFIRDVDARSKVMFNMGLGYLRHRLGSKALLWFMRSAKVGSNQFLKAQPYIRDLSGNLVWTEHGMLVQGLEMVEVDAQDHPNELPSNASGSFKSAPISVAVIQPFSLEPAAADADRDQGLEESDTDSLLSGIIEEGFAGS